MTITEIKEYYNKSYPKTKPIKERMDIFIPDIDIENIPKLNGSIWLLSGSGGSGKSSLMLNFFKSKQLYKKKFHNLYYICPSVSFLSILNHVFSKHDKVYHELTTSLLL